MHKSNRKKNNRGKKEKVIWQVLSSSCDHVDENRQGMFSWNRQITQSVGLPNSETL